MLEIGIALYIDARNPPTERCPLIPETPLAVQYSMNAASCVASSATKVTFIKDRSSTAAVPLKKGFLSILNTN